MRGWLQAGRGLLPPRWRAIARWREALQWVLALGISAGLAAGVVLARDRWVMQQRSERLDLETQNLAALVEAASSKSMVMTGAQMLGVLDNRAKRLALDPRLKSDTAALEDLVTSVQILQARRAAVLDAQGQEVVSLDFNGSVVEPEAGATRMPFVEVALAGRKVAYLDIPPARKTRSLHLLAPIYEQRSTYSRVIGAYYLEAGVSEVEAALMGYRPRIALVVSPAGVAFVGNLPEADLLEVLADVAGPAGGARAGGGCRHQGAVQLWPLAVAAKLAGCGQPSLWPLQHCQCPHQLGRRQRRVALPAAGARAGRRRPGLSTGPACGHRAGALWRLCAGQPLPQDPAAPSQRHAGKAAAAHGGD